VTDCSTNETSDHNNNVDGQLENQELLYVLVKLSSPHDGRFNLPEVIFEENKIGIIFCNITSSTERNTNISIFQSSLILDSFTSDKNRGAKVPETLDKKSFLFRSAFSQNSN
jgi:hypothetical protein